MQDYTNPANWVIYTAADKADKAFDVFYVYPTLVADKNVPLMQWNEKTKSKTIPFARAQLSGLLKDANVYAPFVRQLEYFRAMEDLKKQDFGTPARSHESMLIGMLDSVEAFRYYLTNLNRGRPYILLGHSQGAMDLAIVLASVPEISVQRGFVGAYLLGVVFPNPQDGIAGHPFAAGADDLGVIITWNTQSKDAEASVFAGKGHACINPLNWKTTSEPASAMDNPGARLYDYTNQTIEYIPHYCGAYIDLEKSVLVADPPKSKWTENAIMGKGVYHQYDVYFFYDAMMQNIRLRVERWQQKYGQGNR